jgi:hypothetical protein
LGRRHPELAGYASAVVVVAMVDAEDYVSRAIETLCLGVTKVPSTAFESLVEEYLARSADGRTEHAAMREAQSRRRVIDEIGAYTSTELADLNGSKAKDRSKLATNWRSEGKVFTVLYNSRNVFLAFQFGPDGRPLPVIGEVITALKGWSGWEIAAWFLRPHGLLGQAQPIDLLRDSPDLVREAAASDARRRHSPRDTKRPAPRWLRTDDTSIRDGLARRATAGRKGLAV